MLNIDVSKLDASWKELKRFLKDGMLSGDIWDRTTGLSLSTHNGVPAAVALFGQLTEDLDITLSGSGFPNLGKFYLLNLEGEKMVVVINHDNNMLQGILLDPAKVNLGLLFNVAIPKALESVKSAQD